MVFGPRIDLRFEPNDWSLRLGLNTRPHPVGSGSSSLRIVLRFEAICSDGGCFGLGLRGVGIDFDEALCFRDFDQEHVRVFRVADVMRFAWPRRLVCRLGSFLRFEAVGLRLA